MHTAISTLYIEEMNMVNEKNSNTKAEAINRNKTIIWSKDYCGYCTMAKELMDKSGVQYEERNLSTDEWDMEQLLVVEPGARTMPQIFMDGKHIGGFDDLDAYMFLKFEDEQ